MTGRIVRASYDSLRTTGTSIVCLSPWGDSSPFLLPCIRFRDVVIHATKAATGGTAAIVSPILDTLVRDIIVDAIGDPIVVDIAAHAGFEAITKLANELVFDKPIKHFIPTHSKRLETTSCKACLITLKYKHFDGSIFSNVKDYLSIEKGWFSPYLCATRRRPAIPRSMESDVIFCHGPFLAGDYSVGKTLLAESASVISFCDPLPEPEPQPKSEASSLTEKMASLSMPSLNQFFSRSRSPSPTPPSEPKLAPLPPPPMPRRLLVTVIGLRPHRKFWTTSMRPNESVIHYILLNGCPAIVLPAKLGAPLVAWDALTLEKLWDIPLPDGVSSHEAAMVSGKSGKFEGVTSVLMEYLDLCVEWERFKMQSSEGAEEEELVDGRTEADASGEPDEKAKPQSSDDAAEYKNEHAMLKDALTLLVAAAIRSKDAKKALEKAELEADRAGIVIWRIP
ncbi:hypothetical protein FISHEDRAFT_68204 [Fistulina hepatica ATCC 64428]|uniref:Uncharacterized protein n=1 Tax=Fistulina hepatica ATCC 64428 TaxID=1128425 RepID=A0A0D7A2C9_9AGAR|nr:hypothetical protein FISHEDRAFT_68204 [Fistulina hepatica ATCC 64428]